MPVFQDNKWEVPIKTRYGDIPWSVIGVHCIGKSTFIQSNRCKDIIGYKGNDKFDIFEEYGLVVDSSAIDSGLRVVWSGPNQARAYVTLKNPRKAEIIEWGFSNINLHENTNVVSYYESGKVASIFLYKRIWKNTIFLVTSKQILMERIYKREKDDHEWSWDLNERISLYSSVNFTEGFNNTINLLKKYDINCVIVDCSDSEYRIIQQEEIERVVNG